MHFSSLPSWFYCRVCHYLQCSSSLSQRVKQRVKKLFFCQNLFQLMYNHKPKSNALIRKDHKTADHKGGVNPYGQPDRKKSVFLTLSLAGSFTCDSSSFLEELISSFPPLSPSSNFFQVFNKSLHALFTLSSLASFLTALNVNPILVCYMCHKYPKYKKGSHPFKKTVFCERKNS